MKIGFDGKRAVQNFTGLGNYSRYVLKALQTYYPNEEYLLYAPKKKENNRLTSILQKENITLQLPVSTWWKKLSSIWRVWGITSQLQKDGISIFHGLSNELPLNIRQQNRPKTIVTIHDLIFRRLPQCYPAIDRMIYDYKFNHACKIADRIIAVSQCTKRDIIKDYGISPEKIEVIYQGCDPVFTILTTEKQKTEVRNKYHLPEKYILFVGSIEERKNALLIVRALSQLPENLHLVLVGKKAPYAETIAKNKDQRIHMLHNVPFADLPSIYQMASVFVYPSRYEGFGIPILEALNSRIPVIAATGSCLEEAGGPHSIYVHPDSVQDLVHAIHETLDPPKRQFMIEKGLEWAAKFTEEQMAHQTMKLYKELVSQSNC